MINFSIIQVNPELLTGQILSLTDKSKLKIGENRYIATHREAKGNLSCVISKGQESQSYKTGIICKMLFYFHVISY